MTARNQPHQYRCETCTHDKTKERPDDSIRRILGFQGAIYCEVAGHWLYPNGEGSNYMELVGCASHSSATKAEQRSGEAQIAAYSYIKSIAESRNMSFYDLVDEIVDTLKAEQRIADVIIALEKEISALKGREPKLGTRMEYEMIGRCNSEADGIKYALALLRGKEE